MTSRRPALPVLPRRLLAQATGAVVVVAVLVGVARWVTDATTAQAVYLGVVFMVVAVVQLGPRGQLLVGLSAGIAAGVGGLVAGSTPLLVLATLVACLAQWPFNLRGVAVAALLPSHLVLYAALAPQQPLRITVATWAGAAVAIGIGLLARMGAPPRPAAAGEARRHAVALAVGCTALVLTLPGLASTRWTWAVLTLCLVFVPVAEETRARVRTRVGGTVLGALVAAATAVVAPAAVCYALAAVFAVLTVAYALVPDDLRSVLFLTPTVLLLFGAGQSGAVLSLAAQRVLMTAVGGAVAVVLAVITWRAGSAAGSPR